jgi:uncharacterized repeat protein (TIGR03803 family)
MAATLPAFSQKETVLYNFCSLPNCTDGSSPSGPLIKDSSGNFYGTTQTSDENESGGGTVYRLSPDGTETVLHDFALTPGDGIVPQSGVIMDGEGNLYGFTGSGGAYRSGTAFKLAPDGTETILYSFGSTPTDGVGPEGPVVMDKQGNLYGTTFYGGTYEGGTIFKISPNGTETILHNFDNNGTDGYEPYAGVVLDPQGNLYGTTAYGGTAGTGIAYELSAKGIYTIIHQFGSAFTDGHLPLAPPVIDPQGNLYGTTGAGGSDNAGTAYKLSPGANGWMETILVNFGSIVSQGAECSYGLVLDKTGNLYGVAPTGAPQGAGLAFKLSPEGAETVLYTFLNQNDGSVPDGPIFRDSTGLYGVTTEGGTGRYAAGGTVYKIAP